MRTLLIAAFSLSALTPSRDADACGSYTPEPQVLRLSTHFVPGGDGDRRRTFALLGSTTPPPKLAWKLLAPMSYDATQIANDMMLANPITLTLVGPSGTRVVSSSKHVFLSRSWNFDATASALEVDGGVGFAIAIEGKHDRAKWIELEDVTPAKAKLRTWVTALGVTPYDADSIYVNRVKGTDLEIVSVYPSNGTKMITFLKQGDRNHGRFDGSPLGAFSNGGVTKLVLADGARATAVFLGAS